MAHDIRIIFVKFADRLHNLETLSVLPAEKAAAYRARGRRHFRTNRASTRYWVYQDRT